MNEFALYIQILVTAFCAIAYFMTYKYQSSKLETMDKTVKSLSEHINGQSKIITDFEKYKSIFDIEDFEKRLNLKLDNQKMEMDKQFNQKAKNISDKTLESVEKTLITETPSWMKGWQELSQIAISILLKEFPTKLDKIKRDEYIRKNYPNNAKYFIGFIDSYLEGNFANSNLK
jgi:hypothetical protein